MKIKRIMVLVLVCSMILINSLPSFAEETENYEYQIANISETTLSEINVYSIENIEVDIINFNGYTKPATNLYDDGFGIFQDDNFATYYFNSLFGNYGNNTHGSCGYVAAAMLLSYYDVYLDDRIIEENYDEPAELTNFDLSKNLYSPGIKEEGDSLCPVDGGVTDLNHLNIGNYWEVINNNWEDYFHLYLIKLAEEEFNMYHSELATLEECGITVVSEAACASTMLQQKNVIEHYLYEVKGYTESEISLEYTNVNVRDFAINKIKNGQPVMLLLGGTTGFHLVVAYDLDDKKTEDNSDDDIYAHYGWLLYRTRRHINIDTDEFPLLVSAMALNVNIEHSCSNNYVSSDGTTYCSCYFSCHPDHVCTYDPYDDEQHIYTCNCVNKAINKLDHEFEYTFVDDTYHILKCECGATSGSRSRHTFSFEDSGSVRRRCIGCGAFINMGLGGGGGIYPIFSIKPPIIEMEYSE